MAMAVIHFEMIQILGWMPPQSDFTSRGEDKHSSKLLA
jgi:hypothetical protein